MRRLLRVLLCILPSLILSACTAQRAAPTTLSPQSSSAASAAATTMPTGNLTVFAAASLTEAFGEIGKNFAAAYPGATVTFNFAGSQQLSQQLAQGAPADVFASADGRQMDVSIAAGRIISGVQQTFVHNRLVVIYPKDNPAGLSSLKDLAKPGLKLILAAKDVPVGGYTVNFLNKAATTVEYGATYRQTVLSNVVSYEENVKAVLSKIVLGEGDAGVVYSSDISLDAAEKVGKIDIPDALNTVAAYPIAVIADTPNPALAAAFVAYVLGPDGQHVLAKYGFMPVSPAKPSGLHSGQSAMAALAIR